MVSAVGRGVLQIFGLGELEIGALAFCRLSEVRLAPGSGGWDARWTAARAAALLQTARVLANPSYPFVHHWPRG
jgi:hypothetical protein